ncbi:hypothetical protein GCM10010307_72490 [Streptomyces vastus]|uniref:Uncharacterized protein n=1 Tax=Streptomyces vastus TaxID=285451 RepID=A0ABP6E6C6_9ACTN
MLLGSSPKTAWLIFRQSRTTVADSVPDAETALCVRDRTAIDACEWPVCLLFGSGPIPPIDRINPRVVRRLLSGSALEAELRHRRARSS